jgi:hypothetical protein
MKITHPFISTKGDGPDSTLVRPTNWNADHAVMVETDGVVIGRLPGSGPGPAQEIPFRSMGVYGEVVLAAVAAEMRVNIPPNAVYVQLEYLTNNVGNVNDTPKLNGLNGDIILSTGNHQTQYLIGSGGSAAGSFVNADNGFQLGNGVVATQGTVYPIWCTAVPNQILGHGNLWAITATGTRFAYQVGFDGGPLTQPTGYRIANAGGTNFTVGCYMRSLCITASG